MTFTAGDRWGGRPIAGRVGLVGHRQRLRATGSVAAVEVAEVHRVDSLVAVFGDGTGEVDLLFLGRGRVPGIVPGARLTVEGTARLEGDRLVLWNPIVRLVS